MAKTVHYWTGYGVLCMTPDGRKPSAQCSPERRHITCDRCNELLHRLDEQKRPALGEVEG